MKYTKEEKRWIKSIAPKVWYKGKWIPKNKLSFKILILCIKNN